MRRRRRRRRRRRSLAKRKRFVKFVPWITWTNAGRMFTSNAPIVDIESSIDRVGLSLRFNAYIPGCFDRSLSHSSNRICSLSLSLSLSLHGIAVSIHKAEEGKQPGGRDGARGQLRKKCPRAAPRGGNGKYPGLSRPTVRFRFGLWHLPSHPVDIVSFFKASLMTQPHCVFFSFLFPFFSSFLLPFFSPPAPLSIFAYLPSSECPAAPDRTYKEDSRVL